MKLARTKLRIKSPTRIFVQGGKELTSCGEWENHLRNDIILLVSSGEEYVGSRDADESASRAEDFAASATHRDCIVVHLANQALVDLQSIMQIENTARTLPGMIHAVAQPDLHPGTKYPIGAVFVSKDWIHPHLIGGDIGCGMAWYKTLLSRNQVEGDRGRRIAEKLTGFEGSWRTQEHREIWLQGDHSKKEELRTYIAEPQWDVFLGTIGAGNHFAELQVVEQSHQGNMTKNDTVAPRLHEGEVVLLIHSGSRGFGGDILRRYAREGTGSLKGGESAAKAYLKEHDRACAWASRNRDLIALRFLAKLEPGTTLWDQGMGVGDNCSSAHAQELDIIAARQAVWDRKVIDIHHNNVEKTNWPATSRLSQISKPGKTLDQLAKPSPDRAIYTESRTCLASTLEDVYIHRKGAAPMLDPRTGEPLAMIPLPGSRATPTLILRPTLTKTNEYGVLNAFSLAHGAGRAMSRAKANTWVADKYKGKVDDLLRGDFVHSDRHGNKRQPGKDGRDIMGGTWVICEDKQLVWEEAGEAYKDVWAVSADLVMKGCVEEVGWCRAIVSYKVRKE